ncbi:S1C family serine protease [Sabulicella rubraurantiaca]|uniref:S1C family serine protease n=1 Tax=Sabulicella rubraurantiaca TaxID=2811429 RepID=UPI001A96C5A9|nr:S1C family serine protease [Sabulicella rubraurantiaca]
MSDDDWEVPEAFRPEPSEFSWPLAQRLRSVVSLRSLMPPDATSAATLGTEREGSAVWIDHSGLLLTIGYLITEAETIWITDSNGRVVQGTPLATDFESGLGLVQALGPLPPESEVAELGDSEALTQGAQCVLAASGGAEHAVACAVAARQPFAGQWEYLLENAIFTAPAHPHWGGAGLFGPDGRLVGVGSLILQQGGGRNRVDLNMVVPVAPLLPVLETMRRTGVTGRPVRPWLGLYATEEDDQVGVGSLAKGGPAEQAGVQPDDRILAVEGREVNDLASLWTAVRQAGSAGAKVRLSLARGTERLDITVTSGDRSRHLKAPRLH